MIELAPSSISWDVRAFSLFRSFMSACAVEQSIGFSRLACTCFSDAGGFDEQPAIRASTIKIDVRTFISHLLMLIQDTFQGLITVA
jgi:hypothetical protein